MTVVNDVQTTNIFGICTHGGQGNLCIESIRIFVQPLLESFLVIIFKLIMFVPRIQVTPSPYFAALCILYLVPYHAIIIQQGGSKLTTQTCRLK